MTWQDAVEFCRKLSDEEDLEYRLPTEAEWEYACRAGTTTAYSFGDDASQLGEYAWYTENARNVGQKYAHTVGQKLPNSWGLYDMHGNVWEWCSDGLVGAYPSESVTDPAGPSSADVHVCRGGGWRDVAVVCRSALRGANFPSFRSSYRGFRVAFGTDPSVESQNASPTALTNTVDDTSTQVAAADPVAELRQLGALFERYEQGKVTTASFSRIAKVTDAGLVHLKGLTGLKSLALSGTQITDAGLVHLKALTKLQTLSLPRQITDAGLVHLKGLTNLQTLSLPRQITDAGLVHLMGLTNLKSLSLPKQITDAGLVHLKGLTKLEDLWLRNTQITGLGLVHLKELTNLQELDLAFTKVTGEGLVHLRGLTNLQILHLGYCPGLTNAGLLHLKGLTSLETLELGDTRPGVSKITDAGLVHLKGLTNLEALNLMGTQVTDAGLEHLAGLTNLQKGLNLTLTQITDAGVAELQKALPNCDISKP